MQRTTSPIDTSTDQTRKVPQRRQTQAEQDKKDDHARQKAEQQLVQSWMDRMQLISVITTFFAANEAQLLSLTTPSDTPESTSTIQQASNALLASSLVLHSFAAVIAFIGAFVLVTFRLKEEKEQETADHEKAQYLNADGNWCANPRLEQVGSVRKQAPPVELLKAAHSIAIATAFVGFIFVMVGIMCFVWAQQSRAVSIFSSATLGVCILVSLAIVGPFHRAEKTLLIGRKH